MKPVIYLNNAATTWPKPDSVSEAVTESLQMPPFGTSRTAAAQGRDYISEAREKTGALFHANPESVCFTHNATDALNILIAGFIRAHPNCHAVTTELDHNSVLRPLHEFARAGACSLSIAKQSGGKITPEAVLDVLTEDTKLLVMSHASNVLGSVQNIAEIAKICHERGIFVIADGAQTAGHMPIDFTRLGADAYVFTGHKALFGIPGTGGFILSNPDEIAPVRFGGTGSRSKELYQPEEMPDKYETGTQNFTGLAALCAGIDYIQSRGPASIHEQGLRQSATLIARLKEEENIEIHYECPEVPVISCNIRGFGNDDVGFILARRYGVICRTGLHCAPLVHNTVDGGAGSVRLSLSALTTEEEITAAADALGEIAQNAAR
ncbi:MAG TPA: aminotransferase class V-fold PLP-dependent enzyme [Methanocorpusculum sp.]|nr:aminotransferase class V-fold PLP-dependent enzyme [Methanocorpusculum sp.]